jgi:hypothetical protein
LYWSIRPIVKYACETWVLKQTIKNKIMVFKRKVLRKYFGPTKERDVTIINYIKAQRLSWFCHLPRMPEKRMVKKVYKWKPMLRRLLGRPKNRWEDDIRNVIKN